MNTAPAFAFKTGVSLKSSSFAQAPRSQRIDFVSTGLKHSKASKILVELLRNSLARETTMQWRNKSPILLAFERFKPVEMESILHTSKKRKQELCSSDPGLEAS